MGGEPIAHDKQNQHHEVPHHGANSDYQYHDDGVNYDNQAHQNYQKPNYAVDHEGYR
jgi:hypothetical protein